MNSFKSEEFVKNDRVKVWGYAYLNDNCKEKYLKDYAKDTVISEKQMLFLFRKFGVDFLKDLLGSWALVIQSHEGLVVARDSLGYQSLYYRVQSEDQRVLFSPFQSLLGDPAEDDIDEGSLFCYLMDDYSLFDRSYLQEIKQVQPGEVLQICGENLSITVNQIKNFEFKIGARSRKTVSKEDITEWKDFFLKSIEKQVHGFSKVGLMLSGGLDSSSILAGFIELKKQNRVSSNLKLYHLRFGKGPADTEGVAEELARIFNLEICCIDAESKIDEIRKEEFSTEWNLPYYPTFQMFSPLLKQAQKDGCEMMMFGYGADEQLTPPLSFFADFLRTGKFQDLWYHVVQKSCYGESYFKILAKVVTLFLPHWVRMLGKGIFGFRIPFPINFKMKSNLENFKAAVARRLAGVPRCLDWSRRDMFIRIRTWGAFQFSKELHSLLCSRYQMECRLPFVDHMLIAKSFELPLDYIARPLGGKQILREAMQKLLPDIARTKPMFQDYSDFVKTVLEEKLDYACDFEQVRNRKWIHFSKLKINNPHSNSFDDTNLILRWRHIEKILRRNKERAKLEKNVVYRPFSKGNMPMSEKKESLKPSIFEIQTHSTKEVDKDQKKVYIKPKLTEFGKISDYTQAITATMTADGGVSPSNRKKNCISLPPIIQHHRWLLEDTFVQDQFRRAIFEKVKPGDVVLDLGTGTGIHSLFAVEAGARKVYSIDNGPILNLAKELALQNGYADKIEFIQVDSSKLQLPETVDVIVTNIGFMHTLKDLPLVIDRHLKSDGKVIPESLQLGCALLSDDEFYRTNVDFWSSNIFGVNLKPIKQYSINRPFYGNWDPSKIVSGTLEFNNMDLTSKQIQSIEFSGLLKVNASTHVHGIIGWYTYNLTKEISFSTRPPLKLSPAIWNQWFFPLTNAMVCEQDDAFDVNLKMSWYDGAEEPVWQWGIAKSGDEMKLSNSFESMIISKINTEKLSNFSNQADSRPFGEI